MHSHVETGQTAPDGTYFVDASPGAGTGSIDRPTVVLLHGVGLDLDMWDAQAEALTQSHRVLRYDMLGHGRTPPLERRSTLRDYCDQLGRLLKFRDVSRAILVGFSMGGVITQRFAADRPEVLAGVVMMSTVYRRTEDELRGVRERLRVTEEDGPGGIVELAVERWLPSQFQSANPDAVEWLKHKLGANHRHGYTDAYRVFVEADAEVGDALRQVRCPSMVITGGADVGSTPAIAQRMADDLGGAPLVVLEGCATWSP
ncbi:MAG: alpha/beta fold hydrolase [Pseudomonadota bacterium]